MPEAAATLGRDALVLGRYRPLRPLGSGGSGSVWLARDEAAGREVALKIVAREGKAAERAEREAAAAARLRHARCLRAHALAHDDEHVYIAYEYVPGRTLRDALRAGQLDDQAAVEVAAQVLEGLAHAHAHGIVHRDIKPANVLLADGEDVSVRLLDFGLARMEEAQTLTAVGDVPGTLAYISPERLAGKQAGPASDVWAVGVLLWEALAGFHPFWKPSLLESARAIGSGAPPLATIRPDLPQPLLVAVNRALSREPGRRPSAAKLAAALRRSLDSSELRTRRSRRDLNVFGAVVPAALAAMVAGWSAAALPFYPARAPLALAVLAALATLTWPRFGLALALAVPVLPLGNISLGLAVVYTAVAAGWLALFARESAYGLLFAVGPLLAPISALGLAPLAALPLASPARRAAAAGGAVIAAAIVAGLRGSALPFSGGQPPGDLGIAGSEDAGAVISALWNALAAHPALGLEALALAAGAAALPFACERGRWALAGFGAALLALTLVPDPSVSAFPLVLCIWTTCAVLAFLPRASDAPLAKEAGARPAGQYNRSTARG